MIGDLHDCDLMLAKVERIGLGRRRPPRTPRAQLPRFRRLWQAETSKGTWATLG